MNNRIIIGIVIFLLFLPFVLAEPIIETVPTGSIVASLVTGMAFFTLIGILFLKIDEDNDHKSAWDMLGILFFTFAGFMFNLITFFIMEFSVSESYYAVTRAIFVISSIIFGFIGTIIALVVSIITVIYFLSGTVARKNEKKNSTNESRY